MTREIISTANAPAAVGPYSQAVRSGNLLFTAGQIGLDPAAGTLVGGGVAEQAEQALKNLKAILGAADLELTDVVKTTVFLTSMNDYKVVNAIYANYFSQNPPARSAVAVSELPLGALVEIEAIAVVA